MVDYASQGTGSQKSELQRPEEWSPHRSFTIPRHQQGKIHRMQHNQNSQLCHDGHQNRCPARQKTHDSPEDTQQFTHKSRTPPFVFKETYELSFHLGHRMGNRDMGLEESLNFSCPRWQWKVLRNSWSLVENNETITFYNIISLQVYIMDPTTALNWVQVYETKWRCRVWKLFVHQNDLCMLSYSE